MTKEAMIKLVIDNVMIITSKMLNLMLYYGEHTTVQFAVALKVLEIYYLSLLTTGKKYMLKVLLKIISPM